MTSLWPLWTSLRSTKFIGEKTLQIDQTGSFLLSRILEGGNIHPSNITAYKVNLVLITFIYLSWPKQVSQIQDTVHSATGFKPLLYCYPDSKHDKVQLLQQIAICMNKHFDLIDCPEESYAPCHSNKPVLYPQKPPSTWWSCVVTDFSIRSIFNVLYL